ncbi:MAG TPA: FAD-binding oxidoreductase [Tahibacter sp.]|uniref:NAD(P)/FAD-dependent oxidoreductase n=1 Tax=Tahibacter sp. TaxID=2056211 RepID=UPI002C12EA77|nr:FAD-binding oxidoreductase [Tahibacter sp.]HSX61649.1 FAD-binding oxidoreductase [Tahibacter sp.]
MRETRAESIWRDGLDLGLGALPDAVRADVCVVGLGGSGLSALAECRQAGLRCVGVDRHGVAAGAAGANGGFLLAGQAAFYHDAVQRYGRERALGIYALTRSELARRYAQSPDVCRQTGSLRVAADAQEERDCVAQIEAMQRDGLPAVPYLGAEGRGVLFADDGVFDPARYWRELAATLVAQDVALFRGEVGDIAPGVVTMTSGRTVRADLVFVAVDGGLEALLPQFAGEVHSARLQMLATAPDATVTLQRPVYFRDGNDYWLQRADGRIALGGGRDLGGDEEWRAADGVSPRVQAHLDALLRDRLGSRAAVTHRWSARVAFTQRGLPVFGEIARGVFATGAYDGTGNILGALCGRALARLALGERSALSEWLA